VSGALLPSFVVSTLPILTVLVLLGAVRRPAWQASLAGLLVGLIVAVGPWHIPVALALNAVACGAAFALWPVMWIVFNALLLYNISVESGRFDAFRDWIVKSLPGDRRVILVIIGFCFSALLEGIAGFGTPVAITSSLLIMLDFPALDAVVFALMFNTAPVAFAALGVPITVLSAVTHLPANVLAAMVGRQLPFFALLLPFYVIAVYGGLKSIRAVWPVLLVAGGSFALTQFLCSNFISYSLTDVLSSFTSIVTTLLFLKCWHPAPDPQFAIDDWVARKQRSSNASLWRASSPWVIVSLTVIIWMTIAMSEHGEMRIPWPGLHNAVSITLYKGLPYAAIWHFQPLGTGTAILLAAIITSFVVRLPVAEFFHCVVATLRQIRLAVLTVVLIVGLAYLMNYSGLTYTIGLGVASVGPLFVLLSPFLGWVSVLLSGSDTSGNALFGNLQVVAANQLNLNPILLAATNASGGVMGKMVSPQNLATGMSVTQLQGHEGAVFARTFPHSIALTLLLGVLVAIQQYLIPWISAPNSLAKVLQR
jgi:lactate permease